MKSIKKVLASVLALAMVVTAVPATTAEAATTGVPKTKTYYAGKSYTLTLTTPKSWKSVKTTWSEKNSAISLSSKKTKSVKVKAIKATKKATVKVKVTYKKSSKKGAKRYTKNYSTVITIKNPSLSVSASEATVNVGDSVTVKATAKPSSAKVTYTSADKSIATVSSEGVITGVAAGTTSVTAKAVCGTKTVSKKIAVTVKAVEPAAYTIDMTSLEVKAADTLVAKFAGAVKTDNTTLTLKRGTTVVSFKETWNADGTEVTIKTDAKMTAGTYELTATDKTDATITSSKTATVEAQKAAQIVILNKTALTASSAADGSKNDLAYVYYDVVDQYGESMRNSVSITWSSSVSFADKNVAAGRLTLKRTDTKDFTYGEQIFITGVDTKTGLNVSETLTVGAKQAIDSIEMTGFIKKGTTDILTSLPKDFKSEAYYMIFNALDQNGNRLDADKTQDAVNSNDSITFVSDAPLVIKEITNQGHVDGKVVNIKNEEYATVVVTPGIKVEQGGEVNVTAIANKTGKKTVLNVPVNVSEILKSFELGVPVDIIADGETQEIAFTAKDEKGNVIKNFETIAKQTTFNKLQFSTSEGWLKLSQKDDGTAKLEYIDYPAYWNQSKTTDGLDRPVSLTAIVVGGDTNNEMINIQDKARPNGVANVTFADAYVEGAKTDIYLTQYRYDDGEKKYVKDDNRKCYIEYVDQYGRKLGGDKAQEFFDASEDGGLNGNDFSGYRFGTMVTYTGNEKSWLYGSDVLTTTSAQDRFLSSKSISVTDEMSHDVEGAASGEGCKFAVTKLKIGKGEYTALDRTKNFDYTVVDIKNVQNLSVKDLPKIYVKTNNSDKEYLSRDSITIQGGADGNDVDKVAAGYDDNEVVVEGTYGGKKVAGIDASYVSYTSDKYGLATATDDKNLIQVVSSAALVADQLYDFKSSTINYPRKDAEDILEVTVKDKYDPLVDVVTAAGIVWKSTLKKVVTISDAAPEGTTLVANAEKTTLTPEQTGIVIDKDTKLPEDTTKTIFTLKDQYGKDFNSDNYVFTVKDVVDKDDFADNNFAVKGNSTKKLTITGAERTNTFTLTASYKKLSASVNVTVGADKNAYILNDWNKYLEVLIGEKDYQYIETDENGTETVHYYTNLETQRQNGLN